MAKKAASTEKVAQKIPKKVRKKSSKSPLGASRASSKDQASPNKGVDVFGLSSLGSGIVLRGEPSTSTDDLGNPSLRGQVFFVGSKADRSKVIERFSSKMAPWQLDQFRRRLSKGELAYVATSDGPLWMVAPRSPSSDELHHHGLLADSLKAKSRDLVGSLYGAFRELELSSVSVIFVQASKDEQAGAVIGAVMGSYRFTDHHQGREASKSVRPKIYFPSIDEKTFNDSSALGHAVNMARHLVNVPGGDLNPKTYSERVKALFSSAKHFEVDVWEPKRLESEGMGLHLAVGAAASEGPRLVHLRYRPQGGKAKKPVAMVGKGITFDTGGLNLKPASGMRWMKKDMGGSAALVGFGLWVASTQPEFPCDLYLALAENAVDERAYRPGDIIRSRNGLTVEIHNTDAEGRLVLADALDVAVTQQGSDAPAYVLDLATLTGAMRVALGTVTAGLFATDDVLADKLLAASQKSGDPCWRMPLARDCAADIKSHKADLANAGSSGMGGAISAALFLKRFVRQTPWAHLDIYGWTDRPTGTWGMMGATGQGVQLLAQLASK